jgi:predicted GTPase
MSSVHLHSQSVGFQLLKDWISDPKVLHPIKMMADTSKPSDANMILVMGVTGSGKSYLINQLAGRKVVVESDKLDSCKWIPGRIF